MAKQDDGRDDEMNALSDIPGVNKEKILAQLNPGSGNSDDKGNSPPDDKDKNKGGDDKGKGVDDKGVDDKNKNVPDQTAVTAAMLNEMFGEQFKTVDEVKKANIPAALQELETLRGKNKDLETQLGRKPKHSFASDDLAKFNEFASATGIQSFEVFRKLNTVDIANMDDMDALIWQRVAEDPDLFADIPRVRRSFERKFNVDKSKIEAGDLTQDEYDENLFEMRQLAKEAKKKLVEYKGKIKMPEIKEETPDTTAPKKWMPEVEKKQKDVWGKSAKAIVDVFSKVAIPMKDSKEPIINFVLTDEIKTKLTQDALTYAINNQMEVSETDLKGNEAKMLSVAQYVYGRLISENLDSIAHAIFERARGMSEEEAAKQYNNPSKIERKEEGSDKKSSFEEKRQKAFQADFER
jgi:hypothetical protein